jgi:TonB family protein
MIVRRHAHSLAAIVAAWLAVVPSVALAQDTLARAKDFYTSAAYEEALQILKNLTSKTSGVERTEVAAYQVFCLYALGRSDEAKAAIETIVRVDPLYHPSESVVSPRVRAFFEDARRPLLPEVVRQSYTRAKEAYDKKDMSIALSEFDRVIALLDELSASEDQGVADLRTLATGFRDLAKAAIATPAPPPAAQAPASAPANVTANLATAPAAPPTPPSPAPDRVYTPGDADVKKPTVISQVLPPWRPENPVEGRQSYSGVIEIVVNEEGKVLSAVLLKSVQTRYDPLLLKAAQEWKFRPATKDGKPVRYRYGLNIHLGR